MQVQVTHTHLPPVRLLDIQRHTASRWQAPGAPRAVPTPSGLRERGRGSAARTPGLSVVPVRPAAGSLYEPRVADPLRTGSPLRETLAAASRAPARAAPRTHRGQRLPSHTGLPQGGEGHMPHSDRSERWQTHCWLGVPGLPPGRAAPKVSVAGRLHRGVARPPALHPPLWLCPAAAQCLRAVVPAEGGL